MDCLTLSPDGKDVGFGGVYAGEAGSRVYCENGHTQREMIASLPLAITAEQIVTKAGLGEPPFNYGDLRLVAKTAIEILTPEG